MVFNFLKSSFTKVKEALQKTRTRLSDKIYSVFGTEINEETLDDLEQILFEADLGVHAAHQLTENVRKRHYRNPSMTAEDHLKALKQDILTILESNNPSLQQAEKGPLVILIVGVNGNGKTTSVAKLAQKFMSEGKKVLVAAADTFRAAAIDQLEIWANRTGVEIVKGKPNSDPAAVAFDAVTAGIARSADVVLIDTAGRLHTKMHLMEELAKIKRTCQKVLPQAPHETLLVLDATTGQNALDQAKTFHEFTPITGLVLTKLDGTAKGGLAISIHEQFHVPIKFIGVGEGMNDLEPFNPQNFVNALFD